MTTTTNNTPTNNTTTINRRACLAKSRWSDTGSYHECEDSGEGATHAKTKNSTTFTFNRGGSGVDCGDTLRKGQNVGYQDLHCKDWIRMDSKVKIYIAEMYWMTRQSQFWEDDLCLTCVG